MERRAAVDPALLFGISLALSLVLWWPSFTGALDGSIDITVAGMRYLAALGLSWVAVYGVGTLVTAYGRESRPAAMPPTAPPPSDPASQVPARRAEDEPSSEEPEATTEPAEPTAA
jgi:hypothetical protein